MAAATIREMPRPYWVTWVSSALSNVGDGIFAVALPLLAARLSRNPLDVAAISVAGSIAWLVIALPGGVIIDRMERRWVTVSANLTRMVAVGLLAALVAFDRLNLAWLAVLAMIIGAAEVTADNATQAIIPALVPNSLLNRAVGWRVSTVAITNQFLGGPLGAWLFVAAAWSPFFINAMSFAVAALVLSSLAGSFRVRELDDPVATAASFSGDLSHGLRFLMSHRLLRTLAFLSALVGVGIYMGLGVMVLYLQDEFGLSESAYGVFAAVGVSGGVLGGLAAERVIDMFGRAKSIYGVLAVWAGGFFCIGIVNHAWQAALLSALVSFCVAVWNVAVSTLRQQVTPPKLQGRIGSATSLFSGGAVPVGYLLGGIVGDAMGLRPTFLIGATFTAIAAAVASVQITDAKIGIAGYQYE
jgi:MFS family permease